LNAGKNIVENRRGRRSAPIAVNSSVRTREYLTTAEIERLMAAARKSSRYGHRDATMILIGAYERDANGNILYDAKGNPKVDVTKTDPRRSHVGTWAKADDRPLIGIGEQSGTMQAVSKVPGMNAMSLFHDKWSVSWDMDAFTNVATIVPAVVLTYTGTGAPYYEKLQETAVDKTDRATVDASPTQ
jgi:hypothetical protein